MSLYKVRYAPALIILMLIIMVPSGRSEDIDDHVLTPGELRVEVFLNIENVSLNRSRLEEMEEQGKIKTKGDRYISRGSLDRDLYVMIAEEEGSEEGPRVPYKDSGPSVTIGIPSVPVELEMERDTLSWDLEYDALFTPDMRWYMAGIGYHLAIQEGGDLFFVRGMTSVTFRIESGNVNKIVVEAPRGDLEGLEEELIPLLDEFAGADLEWNADSMELESRKMEVQDPEIDPGSVDWYSAVNGELTNLVEIGILNGLKQEDIDEISLISDNGLSGPPNRIVEFRGIAGEGEGEWISYLMTTFPLDRGLEEDGGPVITTSDVPEDERDVEERMHLELLIIIPVTMILFIIILRLSARIGGRNLMKNAKRKEILQLVKKEPGIHFRELMRTLDLKQGVLSYHLNKMEKAELLRSKQDGMYRRFYPFNSKADLKLNLSDLQKDIMYYVEKDPGINQSRISKGTGRNQALIHYHVRFLLDAGLLWVEKEGRRTKLFLTPTGRFALEN